MVARIALSRRAAQALLFFGVPLVVPLVYLIKNSPSKLWMSIPARLHACDYVSQQVEGTYLDKRALNSDQKFWYIDSTSGILCLPLAQDTAVLDLFAGMQSVSMGFSSKLIYLRETVRTEMC